MRLAKWGRGGRSQSLLKIFCSDQLIPKGRIHLKRLNITAASLTQLKFLSPDLEWRRPARVVNSERVSVFMMRKRIFLNICIGYQGEHRSPGERCSLTK
jgi:hypothetical protein